MGSSYRQDLNRATGGPWAEKLYTAVGLIRDVQEEVYDIVGCDGQYDNAADDGALAALLGAAIQLIESEIPGYKRAGG